MPERDAEFVARYLAGEPIKRIAPGPGNVELVRRALVRAGVPRLRRGRHWWDDAARLSRAGLSNYEIGRRLGRCDAAVRYALRVIAAQPEVDMSTGPARRAKA